MKKYKHRLLTLLSVLAVGASAAGIALSNPVKADAEETVYAASNVLTVADSASLSSGSFIGNSYTAMVFHNGSSVSYKQDLAYRWFTEEGEQFFSMEFAFADTLFDEFTITFESAQNSKTKDGKTVNKIVFTNDGGAVAARINGSDSSIAVDPASSVKISFDRNEKNFSGEYNVYLNGKKLGVFENIGGYFAEYSATTITPLTFGVSVDESSDVETSSTVYLISLNNQSFSLNEEGKIVDDAVPVLVVNQEVKSFQLGYTFDLEYEAIDVLDATVTKTIEYNCYTMDGENDFSTLSTSTPFFENEGVAEEYGSDLLAVRFTLNDDDSSHQTVYYLSWYADPDCLVTVDGTDYIPLIIDENGPYYECIINDDEKGVSVLDEENEAYLAYIEAVKEAAEGIRAGSGNYFYLPSLEDLVGDDETAYTSLNFSIYYKIQTSSSASANASVKYDSLEIEVASVGIYSFRVLFTDDAGNSMYLYNNGRKVKVTASNLWDIDAIPEFSFTVYNYGVEIDDAEEEEIGYVDQKYTFGNIANRIKAISGYNVSYTLYYFEGAYEQYSYAAMIEMANSEEGFEGYIGADGNALYLRKINVYDYSIDDDDDDWDTSDNAYYWYGSGSTFVPQEEGFYILRVVVTDKELYGDKAIAYTVVEVESEQDVMYGEVYWLRDNYITVIFAGIGVLALIGIIILFVIKPKSENIEDVEVDEVDGKTVVKKAKKSKKDKKKDEDID